MILFARRQAGAVLKGLSRAPKDQQGSAWGFHQRFEESGTGMQRNTTSCA
jgi:hypothetical protein